MAIYQQRAAAALAALLALCLAGAAAGQSGSPALASQKRYSISGDECIFPAAGPKGNVLYNCSDVMGVGVEMCQINEDPSLWQACAPLDNKSGSSDAGDNWPQDAQGRLLVDARNASSGQPCLLPAIAGDYLWLTCVSNTTEGARDGGMCPVASGSWERCAPSTNTSQPFSPSFTLGRTGPGSQGQLCSLQPGATPETGCRLPATTCLPLSQEMRAGDADAALDGLGFCATTPVGGTFGVYPMMEAEGIPTPLAHFPLTAASLESILLPKYQGTVARADGDAAPPLWESDGTFGSVVRCNKSDYDALVLASVPYAITGDFAINLWMRRLPGSDNSGDGWQYLFSHDGEFPNQVQLYVAEDQHPAAGLVRAMVYDVNDDDINPNPYLIYLDSNGEINSNGNKSEALEVVPKHGDINDGGWHMITLSTLANESSGYALYVDGMEVAELNSYTVSQVSPALEAPGGDPTFLTDNIFLCSRSDAAENRFYDGSIAHLMLFEDALTPAQVALLYQQYPQGVGYENTAAAAATDAMASSSSGEGSTQDNQTAGADSGGSNTGVIVGATVGAVVGAAALAAAGVYYMKKKGGKGGRFEKYRDEEGAGPAGWGTNQPLAPGSPGTPYTPSDISPQANSIQMANNGGSFGGAGTNGRL